MPDLHSALVTANREAAALHDRAMLLGYNVGVNVGAEIGQEPDVSFQVWRVDQPSDTALTFPTVDNVKDHLEYLGTLPRYCLDLEDNSRVEVISDADGRATWITDMDTGQRFGIRTEDLENTTRICVHAETSPTIGNWRKA